MRLEEIKVRAYTEDIACWTIDGFIMTKPPLYDQSDFALIFPSLAEVNGLRPGNTVIVKPVAAGIIDVGLSLKARYAGGKRFKILALIDGVLSRWRSVWDSLEEVK